MAKQKNELPGLTGKGVEPIRIAAVDEAVEHYLNMRNRRMQLTEKEVEAKDALSTVLHAHEKDVPHNDKGALIYNYEDDDGVLFVVTAKPGKEELKVTKQKENDNGEE